MGSEVLQSPPPHFPKVSLAAVVLRYLASLVVVVPFLLGVLAETVLGPPGVELWHWLAGLPVKKEKY